MTRQRDTFEACSHQVAAAVGAGVPVTDAAREAGVSPRTVSRWLSRGRREPGSRYAAFAAAVDAARETPVLSGPMTDAEFELVLARSIRKGNVQAMRVYVNRKIARERSKRHAAGDPFAFTDELAARRKRRSES